MPAAPHPWFPYLWLAVVLSQAALLGTYVLTGLWRRFPWWCGVLGFQVVGSGVLWLAGDRRSWAFMATWTILTMLMQGVRFMAVWEVYRALGSSAMDRDGVRAGVTLAFTLMLLSAVGPWFSPMKWVRSGIQCGAVVLLVCLGAGVTAARVQMRMLDRALRLQVLFVSAMLATDILRRAAVNFGVTDFHTAECVSFGAVVLVNGLSAWALMRRV